MNYSLDYQVNEDHIDIQGIMDGLYYPFYMEDCRHKFVKEVLHFDIEEEAKKGINMVLTGYTLKFLRPLKSGDAFQVNCGPAFRANKEIPQEKIYFKRKKLKRSLSLF